MSEFLNSSFSNSLAIVLMHSLWQAGLLYLLLRLISPMISKGGAATKYGLALGALLIFVAVNFLTMLSVLSEASVAQAEMFGTWTNLKFTEIIQTTISGESLLNQIQSLRPYFVLFWWLGLVLFTIRFAFNLYHTHRLRHSGLSQPDQKVIGLFNDLVQRFKMSGRIRLALSGKVLSPAVIGFVRPIVLLPIGLVNGLTTDEVEAILIHELSHIRRNDYLVNIMQSMVEVVYFFNPFVWLISNEIRAEREHVCDDRAIAAGIPRRVYAEILANIYEHAYNNNNLAVSFADRKQLTLKRIRRIMKTQSSNNRLISSLLLVLAVTTAIYLGAEKHLPEGYLTDFSPERIAVASPIGSISMVETSELIADLKRKLDTPREIAKPLNLADTIDEKEYKKKMKEYEAAVERLHSSKEWKELEAMREEMFEEQLKVMKELKPQIEEALKAVDFEIKIDEVELEALREHMTELEFELQEIELDEEVVRAMEQSARVIEESMAQVEAQLEAVQSMEFEKMAREYEKMAIKFAEEAEEMAEVAEKAAAEAEIIARKVDAFMDDLTSELVKDGYIKSKEDLDDLDFEDGKVFVNKKEVSSKHAKKYYEIRKKHLGENTDFFNN